MIYGALLHAAACYADAVVAAQALQPRSDTQSQQSAQEAQQAKASAESHPSGE